jgi:hypothetical protein
MSETKAPSAEDDVARDALRRLLGELPAEFRRDPAHTVERHEFRVIKQSNVRKVHRALWDLQQTLGYTATRDIPPGEGSTD